jgi:hypothetical protein
VHDKQVEGLLAPTLALNVPSGQLAQDVAPLVEEYLPVGHDSHTPPVLKEPAEQTDADDADTVMYTLLLSVHQNALS